MNSFLVWINLNKFNLVNNISVKKIPFFSRLHKVMSTIRIISRSSPGPLTATKTVFSRRNFTEKMHIYIYYWLIEFLQLTIIKLTLICSQNPLSSESESPYSMVKYNLNIVPPILFDTYTLIQVRVFPVKVEGSIVILIRYPVISK